METFWVADLTTLGDLVATTPYRYAQLDQIPAAAELIIQFATSLYAQPQEFEIELTRTSSVIYRWLASAATAGIGTLRCNGELASLALLASGINPEADMLTLNAFQKHLLRELRDTKFEPSFSLLSLEQRPLVAVVPFSEPPDSSAKVIAALADRCFAAVYFRYLHLA